MPIKHNGKDNFKVYVDERIQAKKDAMMIALEDVGNGCVRTMRDPGRARYTDRTNNLRSSTGYVVVDGGRIVTTSGFKPEGIGKDGDGMQGSQNGTAYADELASEVRSGEMAVILVAGMNYAEYVEAKGLDVMASATLQAKEEVKECVEDIFRK